jgi:FkbM family methyltransferase
MARGAQTPDASPLRQAFRALVPRLVRAALHAAMLAPARWPGVIARQAKRAGRRLAVLMTSPAPVARFDKPSFQDALLRLQQHDLAIRSIVNIGAGSGGDTEFVQRMWPEACTLLVEMDARFEPGFRKLKADIPNLAWDICAAGPHDGAGAMSKTTVLGGSIDPDGNMASSTPVQFKRIDTLVREHRLEAPYFLRFDTHGFELDVLAGATETLQRTALIMMEVYNFKLAYTKGLNFTFDEMSLHMKSLGFRCIDICDPLFRPGDHALWQMHLFFIRADHPLFSNSRYSAVWPARDA